MPGDSSSSESDFKRANEYLKEYIVMTDDTLSKTYLEAELADKMIAYSKQFYGEYDKKDKWKSFLRSRRK